MIIYYISILYILGAYIYILYHVLHYRRKTVRENLTNSFPGKQQKEIRGIERRFFRYFCDLFLETFKTLTISKENMVKHCEFVPETLSIFDQLANENQSFMVVMGHFGNWEWGGNTFSICCNVMDAHCFTCPQYDAGSCALWATSAIVMDQAILGNGDASACLVTFHAREALCVFFVASWRSCWFVSCFSR